MAMNMPPDPGAMAGGPGMGAPAAMGGGMPPMPPIMPPAKKKKRGGKRKTGRAVKARKR